MEEERDGVDGVEGGNVDGQRQSTATGGGVGLKKFHMDREEAVKERVILLKYFHKEGKKFRSSSRKSSSQTSSSKSEKDDGLPDGAAIDIYLEMWEGVFTFVPKLEALGIFQANHWDVKNTMIELEKLDKQNKAQQNQQSEEEEENSLKTEVGDNSEEQRMLGVTEEEERFTINSVEEKLKAEKELVTDNVRSTSPVLHQSIRATSSVLSISLGEEICHTSMTTNNKSSLSTLSHPAIVCLPNPEMEELEKKVKVEIVVKEENMEMVEEELCESEEDDDMPDGPAIDKYLEMWDMVYNFVSKMESLEIFRANRWDVRETMIELGKLDKEYKAQLKQRREDVEKTSKKKAAEKREKLRMLGLAAEREQEMNERLKTRKESVKGPNFTTQLVEHNTGSDNRHTTHQQQLPLKLKCSAQKALPLTQHQQEQLLSLIKDREVTLTCSAFDPKARCWEEITQLFNASHPEQDPRSPKQLKQCWKNIRRSTRNKALKAAYLQLRRTTDGAPPTNPPKYSQYLEMAIDLAMGEMAEEFGVTLQHTQTHS
ncbi:hypothetical protein Pcinc_039141 [Petrolisthes cinctipes]|uniref:Regulatory protein zeste n=1 Tax=Petrolisthes cinctipes TaxID=88211 RepID=A0AAE1BS50_PETCI|nr:hypothetical protein Pcinc_039141 [Petrolisthes cinctipes]